MILIGATSVRRADVAYQILVSLYSYTIVILIGFFTAGGLLYVRYFGEEGRWVERSGFKPWGGPTAAIIYTAICAFLIIAPFVPPNGGSPFLTEVQWFVIPTVGLSFLVVGYIYYLVLMYGVPRFFMKNKELVADREAVIVRENGEYVQHLEIVDASWEARLRPASDGDVEMHTGNVLKIGS
jgi:amino acid permease